MGNKRRRPHPSAKLLAVRTWLLGLGAVIVCMVAVGGLTRLTDSGLSMVEWEPIRGAIPPVTQADWQTKFDLYKQFSQFNENPNMTMAEFKFIFLWEYGHRMLGRLIGLLFFLPFSYFLITKALTAQLQKHLLLCFCLGGLQGFLGWFMVQSGLGAIPRVSHFRLAAHLSLALILMSYLLMLAVRVRTTRSNQVGLRPRQTAPVIPAPTIAWRHTTWLLGLIWLQIIFGAFTAGLDAGLLFGTFPKMGTDWVPPGIMQIEPRWLNPLMNPITIQFLHRAMGIMTLAVTISFAFQIFRDRKKLHGLQTLLSYCLLMLVALQVSLGILVILNRVPVPLASAHQITACLLLANLIGLRAALQLGLKKTNGPITRLASFQE